MADFHVLQGKQGPPTLMIWMTDLRVSVNIKGGRGEIDIEMVRACHSTDQNES